MPKKSLRHHIIHKSKLSLLLILKIFFIFLSFYVVMAIFTIFSPWTNLDELTFTNVFVWMIGLAIATLIYLMLIIKTVDLFKFEQN
ncbi:MAG: hypothetical protein ABSG05_02130 [Candidatus Pacearchaeota archaeon]|jgi:hypothetical protein